MVTETPSFAIQLGDIAYEEGTFEQFQSNYFDYYWTLMRRVCFFLVAGNHEYYTPNAAPYMALTSPPIETVPAADGVAEQRDSRGERSARRSYSQGV